MNDLFIYAAQHKLRFASKQGQLTVEELWDLPLTTTRANMASLDEIAINLDKQIKEAGTTSFVKKTTSANVALKAAFDIVLFVISVKQAAEEAAATAKAKAEQKQQILELIREKQNDELKGKSIDELRELVGAL